MAEGVRWIRQKDEDLPATAFPTGLNNFRFTNKQNFFSHLLVNGNFSWHIVMLKKREWKIKIGTFITGIRSHHYCFCSTQYSPVSDTNKSNNTYCLGDSEYHHQSILNEANFDKPPRELEANHSHAKKKYSEMIATFNYVWSDKHNEVPFQ